MSPKFMSDHIQSVSQDLLKEYLTLAQHGHLGTLLAYWKSGGHLLSYLSGYKLGDSLRKRPQIRSNRFLYQDGRSAARHLKVDYVRNEIFGQSAFPPLWLPPLKPYYKTHGPFDSEMKIKKGLIFSSWGFVPRQISAELSASAERQFKARTKRSSPLKATPVTWARFYHPSTTLASLVTHQELVKTRKLEKLRELVKGRLIQLLSDAGIPIVSKTRSKAWEVVQHLDFGKSTDLLRRTLKVFRGKHSSDVGGRGQLMEDRYSKVMREFSGKVPSCSTQVLRELIDIALCSPAVAIARSFREIIGASETQYFERLQKLCLTELKNFLNRSTTVKVISSSYRRGRYAEKVELYFRDGNFQAVIDEYLYLLSGGRNPDSLPGAFNALSSVFRYHKSSVEVHKNSRKRRRVATHVAMAFGESQGDSEGRDDVRVAFNSPFWPFVLSTTSVGQEGLDFHLYCSEIFHWNLPSNPVDLEQREGRINRYRSYMVRKNLCALRCPPLNENELLWEKLFEYSQSSCHRNDRYNFGLSPDWIFTPRSGAQQNFIRHILDLPNSGDRARYEYLMDRLKIYRLAFGQPNQSEYLRKLNASKIPKDVEVRSLYLDLFPHQKRDMDKAVEKIASKEQRMMLLIRDCFDKAREVKDVNERRELRRSINCHSLTVKRELGSLPKNSRVSRTLRKAIEALLYFVSVHDEANDRLPGVGLADDLVVLRKAA